VHQIWPTDGTADVRFYGDPQTVLSALDEDRLPAGWLSFRVGEIDRRTYYRSLDYFVHYPQQRWGAEWELPLLETLASGCVAVLPPWMEPVYGEAVLYAEPAAVAETIAAYTQDPQAFRSQSERGVEFARTHRHSASGYRDLIHTLVA